MADSRGNQLTGMSEGHLFLSFVFLDYLCGYLTSEVDYHILQ